MEQLESDKNYSMYHEPKVPSCFLWLYTVFLEIYAHSGESITWTTIESYGNIRNVKFNQFEIDYLLKMSSWAENKKSEMREEKE